MTSVTMGPTVPITLKPIEEPKIGLAIANFRPKLNSPTEVGWKGEFGFDWLRIGDDGYDGTTRRDVYRSTIRSGYGSFKKNPPPLTVTKTTTATIGNSTVYIGRPPQNMEKEDALELLGRTYGKRKIERPTPVNGFERENYFVSYLNIYPSGAVENIGIQETLKNPPAGGSIVSTEIPRSEAELRVAIEVLEDVNKIELEYNKKHFTIDKPILLNTLTAAGTKMDVNIKIKCNPEPPAPQMKNGKPVITPPLPPVNFDGFDIKQEIVARAYSNDPTKSPRIAGKIVVLPNSAKRRKHIDIVYVNVRINPSGTSLSNLLPLTADGITHIQHTLHQSLIDCTIVEGPNLDMSSDPMFLPGVAIPATGATPSVPTNTFMYPPMGNPPEYYIYSTVDTKTVNVALYDHLENEYISQFPQYAGYFFIFYIDAEALFFPEGFDTNGIPTADPATGLIKSTVLKGQGKEIGTHSVILFRNYQVARDISNPNAEVGTVSHEILHGLGLHHSFPNASLDKESLFSVQKFVFIPSSYEDDAAGNITNRPIATDNVMDYPPATQVATWHWQWKIVNP